MPWSKEEILERLSKERQPLHKLAQPGDKVFKYPLPKQYFTMQDFCVSYGIADPKTSAPDLLSARQGLEYWFLIASGEFTPKNFKEAVTGALSYLDHPEYFHGGMLHMFPDFTKKLVEQILELPRGRRIIAVASTLPEYKGLFE